MFPGDPSGKPALVWNCRCTMRTVEKEGIEAEPRMMRVRNPVTGRNELVQEMTYDEWLNWKNSLIKSPENGIITTRGIDIIIDGFTPCLENVKTGEYVSTTYALATTKELTGLKKKGWLFNWRDKNLSNSEIYKLTLTNDDVIQGLIAIENHSKDMAYHVSLVESAPHNKGTEKQYNGVGGHLFAIAAKKSIDAGYGGFLFFEAKNKKLVKHYEELLKAQFVGMPHPYSMHVDEKAALKLLEKYTLQEVENE